MNDDWIIFADAFVDPMIIRVIYLSILRRKKKKERKKNTLSCQRCDDLSTWGWLRLAINGVLHTHLRR